MQLRSIDWRFFAVVVLAAFLAAFLGRQASRLLAAPAPPTEFSLTPPDSITFASLDDTEQALLFREVQRPRRPALILVLSVECRLCQMNMVNWKHLVESTTAFAPDSPDLVLILTTSSASQTRDYLAEYGLDVPVGIIDRDTLVELGVRVYPTTMVPVSEYEIRVWEGLLTDGAVHRVREAVEDVMFEESR